MKILTKIATILSLGGALLMARGLAFECNVIWVIADIMWSYHMWKVKEYEALILFLTYVCICMYGVYYLWPW